MKEDNAAGGADSHRMSVKLYKEESVETRLLSYLFTISLFEGKLALEIAFYGHSALSLFLPSAEPLIETSDPQSVARKLSSRCKSHVQGCCILYLCRPGNSHFCQIMKSEVICFPSSEGGRVARS